MPGSLAAPLRRADQGPAAAEAQGEQPPPMRRLTARRAAAAAALVVGPRTTLWAEPESRGEAHTEQETADP